MLVAVPAVQPLSADSQLLLQLLLALVLLLLLLLVLAHWLHTHHSPNTPAAGTASTTHCPVCCSPCCATPGPNTPSAACSQAGTAAPSSHSSCCHGWSNQLVVSCSWSCCGIAAGSADTRTAPVEVLVRLRWGPVGVACRGCYCLQDGRCCCQMLLRGLQHALLRASEGCHIRICGLSPSPCVDMLLSCRTGTKH
jgi:hypothetical protein